MGSEMCIRDSNLSKKPTAERPIQIDEIRIINTVDIESNMEALGTAISLIPNGTGGCSTSSGVSDIHERVTFHLPSPTAIKVGPLCAQSLGFTDYQLTARLSSFLNPSQEIIPSSIAIIVSPNKNTCGWKSILP